MINRPETRTPVELWERILCSVIVLDRRTAPIFETTCSAATYLAFKRTCGDGKSKAYDHAYRISEQNRRALRLVCRAWKEFADRWDNRRRWIRLDSSRANINDETWRGLMRLDFHSLPNIRSASPPWALDPVSPMKVLFLEWSMLGIDGGWGMRLQRLEMLHIPGESFHEIFKGLCGVAKVLDHLRSLSLSIPSNGTRCFKSLSTAFPELTHLTLHITHRISENNDPFSIISTKDESEEIEWGLVHRKLEVLFLFSEQFIRLDNWRLPSLQHVHFRPAGKFWTDNTYPFLQRHADTIVSLDLDDANSSSNSLCSQPAGLYEFPAGFWEAFSRLQLLRCALAVAVFEDYPRAGHPLKYLVDTDSIDYTAPLVKILRTWVDGPSKAALESIAVFGHFLSQNYHLSDKGELKGLLQLMRWDGIKLVNPAGRQWVESL